MVQRMILGVVHCLLSLITVYNLFVCLIQLIVFISCQDCKDMHVLKYSYLMRTKFRDWTDDEVRYIAWCLFKDFFLVGLFVLQHSIMATDIWKKLLSWFNIYVSGRLLYVLASCLALTNVMHHWQRIPDAYLWNLNTAMNTVLWVVFWLVQAGAWTIILLEVLAMDPLELIGLKQIYFYYIGNHYPLSYKPKELRLFYRNFRHAGPLGLWLILWIHPVMTYDRLLLAVLFSVYIWTANEVTTQSYKFAKRYFY